MVKGIPDRRYNHMQSHGRDTLRNGKLFEKAGEEGTI